ncbi:MAG: hypothetical protein KDI46_07075 [Alphaproteobacteria bacterium]|nr:hypothetical protein [Alphaproteobacteria bacterium]
MKAVSSASGGVIFMPDDANDNISRKPVSYREFIEETQQTQKQRPFGKKQPVSRAQAQK